MIKIGSYVDHLRLSLTYIEIRKWQFCHVWSKWFGCFPKLMISDKRGEKKKLGIRMCDI